MLPAAETLLLGSGCGVAVVAPGVTCHKTVKPLIAERASKMVPAPAQDRRRQFSHSSWKWTFSL